MDRHGRRAGKVDDLLLELSDLARPPRGEGPEVVGIITGPLAVVSVWPRWLQWLARQIYRALGVGDPQPVCIPWSAVSSIDVIVHVDVDRDEVGATILADAVRDRVIDRFPGAGGSER